MRVYIDNKKEGHSINGMCLGIQVGFEQVLCRGKNELLRVKKGGK